MTQRTSKQSELKRLRRQAVEVDFDGGTLTSDGGLLLLREIDKRLNLIDQHSGTAAAFYSGRLWEGRFKSQVLLDEASILACAMYVDLNPIRAAMAAPPRPQTSDFTGAKDRLDDQHSAKSSSLDPEQIHAWVRSGQGAKSGWMSPIEIDEAADPTGPDKLLGEDARRSSSKGFLNLSLSFYLDLLDWTGRNLASGKRGATPDHLDPILKRVGIASFGLV